MSKYYYHLNVNKQPNAQWSVGDIIQFEGYSNYYKNIIDLCVYCLNGEDSVPIDFVLTLPEKHYESQKIALYQRAKALKHLHRELVFESVRSSTFPHLPSRQTCTYLLPGKDDLSLWIDSLNETKSPYSLLLVEPLSDAIVFETREGPLSNLLPTYNDDQMVSKAKEYWSCTGGGRTEILVQGGVKVIEIVSS